MADELIAMGCNPAIAEMHRKPPPVDFDMEPDAIDVLRVFLQMQTQWVMNIGIGGVFFVGLNYQSLDFVFRITKVERQDEVFGHLQAMELAALEILNKKNGDGA